MKRVTYFMVLIVGIVFVLAINADAEIGVTSNEILLGQSCALTGPAEALGLGMRDGLLAAFETSNAEGGINGKKIKLISMDDGYEPEKAINNTRNLIDKEKVFLLVGEVGTPTSKAVVPIAEEASVPFLGPFTGAEFLRNPYKKYVVNVRASYYQEMEKLTEYLVGNKKLSKIACFYQNDGYGQAGLDGIKMALEKRSMKLIATGSYERNTLAVKGGLLQIRKETPDAVVMVGAYKPCAEFIKLAKKTGMENVLYCNISFVGTEALVNELGAAGEGCVISQVVRFPWDESVPLVKEYQIAMKKFQPNGKIGFISFEGYMVGKFFCLAAKNVKGELTRENFINTIDTIKTFDLGGAVLEYGPNDHQGMDEVFLTIIKDGGIQPLK
jgi:branched-chain amino acid transport system substrate-binding protein